MFFKFKAIYSKRVYFVLGTFHNRHNYSRLNTCVVTYCKTGYKKRQHEIHVIPEKFPVFRFPLKNPELNREWIRFVNTYRRD